VLDEVAPAVGDAVSRPVRLRDLMMPVWAEVYYELVFGEPCPRAARDLIVGNADDVVSALKCTRLRHMRRRNRLTRYLRRRIDTGEVPFEMPDLMTPAEQAWYLQGAFFNTAVVQMSEAMAHLLLAIAEHPSRSRLALMRLGDRWETVWRSVVQLVLGTLMVADARRLALCRNYFADHPEYLPANR
jgi:hypothetical protein